MAAPSRPAHEADLFRELLARSERCTLPFHTRANRLRALPATMHCRVSQMAAAVRPLVLDRTLSFLDRFIAVKRAFGSSQERRLYTESLTARLLIQRLLTCRPVVFTRSDDLSMLRDASEVVSEVGHTLPARASSAGYSTLHAFDFDCTGRDAIAKSGQHVAVPPFDKYLSYDEMAVAALIGISVPTYFISKGETGCLGEKGAPGTFEPVGVYTGVVGARLEREGLMEHAHCLVTPAQNTRARGYGAADGADGAGGHGRQLLAIWAAFYGCRGIHMAERAPGDGLSPLPTWAERREAAYFPTHAEVAVCAAASDEGRRAFPEIRPGLHLHCEVYRRRIAAVMLPFLADAGERARAAGARAYVHVTGIGLGAWAVEDALQGALIVDTVLDLLGTVAIPAFAAIADIDFSWFPPLDRMRARLADVVAAPKELSGAMTVARRVGGTVHIHFSYRDVAARLEGEHAGKLLVASFGWNANAYVGNEYWGGMLAASESALAACCSGVPELGVPDVNPAAFHTSRLHVVESRAAADR